MYPFHAPGAELFDPIQRLYTQRLKAKVQGNDALQYACKLMLNSIYGKFAEAAREEETFLYPVGSTHPNEFDGGAESRARTDTRVRTSLASFNSAPDQASGDPREEVRPLPGQGSIRQLLTSIAEEREALGKAGATDAKLLPNGQLEVTFRREEAKVVAPVLIAATVTGESRRIMDDVLLDNPALQSEVYYTDTDSFVCTQSLVDALQSRDLISDYDLGKFAVEHANIRDFWALAPKLYTFVSHEGRGEAYTHRRCRGIPLTGADDQEAFDAALRQDHEAREFEEGQDGDATSIPMRGFVTLRSTVGSRLCQVEITRRITNRLWEGRDFGACPSLPLGHPYSGKEIPEHFRAVNGHLCASIGVNARALAAPLSASQLIARAQGRLSDEEDITLGEAVMVEGQDVFTD